MRIFQSELAKLAQKYQFPVSAVISAEELLSGVERIAELPGAAGKKAWQQLEDTVTALQAEVVPGAGRTGCFLVCGLSCHRQDEESIRPVPGRSSGLFASFARRNYYKEVVIRLKQLGAELRSALQLKKSAVRIFCNSAFPEKLIAWLAGIGFYGRNSLIINPVLGSDFVIGGIFLPVELEEKAPARPPAAGYCTTCTRCADACPARAITGYAEIDNSKCFQALAARFYQLTDECMQKWGARIYGCQDCQDACPYNSKLTCHTETTLGVLGPAVPLADILAGNSGSIRRYFRGTVLDRSWIDARAILRNALVAAGNSRDRELIPVLEKHLQAEEVVIRDTARWAINRILQEAVPGYL